MVKQYYPVASINDLIPGRGLKINIKNLEIALFRDKENIYAVQNKCPHQQAELSDGYIMNKKLYCSLHHWSFSLPDGKYDFNPELRLKTYETIIENGQICIVLDQ